MSDSTVRAELSDEVLEALGEVDITHKERAYLAYVGDHEGLRLIKAKKSFGGVLGIDLKANIIPNPFEEDPYDVATPVEANVDAQHERRTEVVRVGDLRPNSMNGDIWDHSLAEESIAELASDVAKHGLRQHIEVNERMEILDGERRWRALMSVDRDREVEVVVIPNMTDPDQIEEYILDAYTSVRDASIEERVKVYDLARKVLKRTHGRDRGRPEKMASDEVIYWSTKEVAAEAAKRAGFGSAEIARRASKVIGEGDDELRQALAAGDVSISGAYETLRQPSQPEVDIEDLVDLLEPQNDGVPEAPADDEASEVEAEPREEATASIEGEIVEEESTQVDEPLVAASAPIDSGEDASEPDLVEDCLVEQSDEVRVWDRLDEVRDELTPLFRTAAAEDPKRAVSWFKQLKPALSGSLREALENRRE